MKRISVGVILLVSLLAQIHSAQGQVLEGYVRDGADESLLAGATIQLTEELGAITDAQGYFRLTDLKPGRYEVTVGFVGYQIKIISDVLIRSGQTTTIEIELQPRPFELEVVQVTDRQPFQASGKRTITAEQINRFASTYYDPARLIVTSPDVQVTNDQNNQISVRGISPNYNAWRLEGVEIVNPNHLSNAGTFSDQPTQSGGGVNAISAQVLGQSSFEYGAMPTSLSNSVGGIFDLNLRKGTSDQYQFAAQASFIGFDLMAEGPLGKKDRTSFLANYRYSFTGLLTQFGVDFGGERIGFQDLTFSTNTRFKNEARLKVFFVGADNFNYFDHLPFAESERQKDRSDIYFDGNMGIAGMRYQWKTWDVSWATSTNQAIRKEDIYDDLDAPYYRNNTKRNTIIHSGQISKKTSFSRGSLQAQLGTNLYQSSYGYNYSIVDDTWSASMVYAGLDWEQYLGAHWLVQAGLKGYLSGEEMTADPRIRLNYLTKYVTYYASAGRYSQLLNPDNYLFNAMNGYQSFDPNVKGFIQSDRFITGANLETNDWSVSLEGFYYSFPRVSVLGLEPTTAATSGISLSLEKNARAGWYIFGGGSVFESTFGANYNNTYNSRINATISGGKQWRLSAEGSKTLDINLRGMFQGGLWYNNPGIYTIASYVDPLTIAIFPVPTFQTSPYERLDLRIQYVNNKEKSTRTIALDIQNVLNRENESYPYYDYFLNQVQNSRQLGMIPILTYRIDF